MKLLVLLTLLFAVSCTPKNGEEKAKIKPIDTSMHEVHKDKPHQDCICTKEYNPVCGANGLTYPSPCQAACDGVTDYRPGNCPKQ